MGVSRSDGSSAGAAQSVRLEVVGVIRDGGSADVGVIGVRSFGAVGEYTNTGAAAENTGVFGLGLLLTFLRTYSLWISCFLVSQIDGAGFRSIGCIVVSAVGLLALAANSALLARSFLLRSLWSRRISCCLVSHGVVLVVVEVVVGGGGDTVVVVEVSGVVGVIVIGWGCFCGCG